jgi:hypothetical protein
MADEQAQTQEEYVNHGGNECPKCKSTTIDGGDFDLETFNRDCECYDCGHTWSEIYKLSGYESNNDGEEDEED